jgi:predicted porin
MAENGGFSKSSFPQNRREPAPVLGCEGFRSRTTYGSHEAETTITAKTRNNTLGMGANLAPNANIDLIVTHYRVKRTRTALVEDGFNRTLAFLEYKLSKRTRLYAELDQTRWKNGYQGVGFKSSASGISTGIVHTF